MIQMNAMKINQEPVSAEIGTSIGDWDAQYVWEKTDIIAHFLLITLELPCFSLILFLLIDFTEGVKPLSGMKN